MSNGIHARSSSPPSLPPPTLFAPGRLVSLIRFLVLRRSVLAFDACSDRVFDAFLEAVWRSEWGMDVFDRVFDVFAEAIGALSLPRQR